MKPRYEKPVIIKQQTGIMNKFGSNPLYSRKVRKEIDGVSLDDLTENYGSPLFVYSDLMLRTGAVWTTLQPTTLASARTRI